MRVVGEGADGNTALMTRLLLAFSLITCVLTAAVAATSFFVSFHWASDGVRVERRIDIQGAAVIVTQRTAGLNATQQWWFVKKNRAGPIWWFRFTSDQYSSSCVIPLWVVVMPMAIGIYRSSIRLRAKRAARGKCGNCGYELDRSAAGARCPECGVEHSHEP